MADPNNRTLDAAELRERAEDLAREKASLLEEDIGDLSLPFVRQTLHELRVHQIELEMQNEELRRAQLELETTRARYFDLYDLAPMGYCTLDEQGMILQTNLTAALLLGVTRSELVERPMSRFVLRADQDIYYLHRKRLLETGDPQAWDLRMVKPDGTPFWAHLEATAALDEAGTPTLRFVLSDVSARKEAEAALVKEGALHSAIFNSAKFLSIATDAKGVIQLFNVGAESMLGYRAADVMNKLTPFDLADPEEVIARAKVMSVALARPVAPGFEALVFKASRGIEDIYELTCIRQDGGRLPMVLSVSALRDGQTNIIGYLLIGTDNTAQKQIEAERATLNQALEDRNADLEYAKVVAEKANLAKSEFLSSMSHELRTPLGAILGFAQLLDAGTPPPTPTQKLGVDQILKAGWYLLELINEILDLAKIESGKLALSLEPISLAEVMQDCRYLVEAQAEKRSVSMTYPQFGLPTFVQADQKRLKQILVNLLSNVIKYNQVGGKVEVSCLGSAPGRLRICIQDTGAGLAPEQIAQLFQPFNRLEQREGTVEGAVEGTGIGLVVCKRLVELMRGVIGVESTVGKGSVFWIELDLSAAPKTAAAVTEPAALSPAQEAGPARLQTLLYVEDNPANLMLVEEILARRPDLRLLSATDGTRGIEIARTAQPDIILMDISLPGISGIEALKILTEGPTTAHIPVVAISANALLRDIELGLEAGFFRYLTKPIKVTEFLETVDLALTVAKQNRPA
ncbi:MAG: PAS domain S-box protein [Geothrix sp.]|nr:PAS domain S-box protein [Geothrix sp.]